jgi:type IV secretion system protein VirB4
LNFTAAGVAGMKEDAREMAVSEMIPYTVHYDDHTVVTKDNALVQVIKIDGLFFDALTREQIRQFERQRNTVLRAIANSNLGIYVHLVRQKITSYPDGVPEAWFAKQVNAIWRAHYAQHAFFTNDIYISIVCNRFRQGVPGILDRLFSLVTGARLKNETWTLFDEQAKEIAAATDSLMHAFSSYGARRLGILRRPVWDKPRLSYQEAKYWVDLFGGNWQQWSQDSGTHASYAVADIDAILGEDQSELGGFFHYLINLEAVRVPVSVRSLDQVLSTSWLNFNTVGNVMSVQNADTTRVAAILSMAEWPNRTPSHMLDVFLTQPVECIITQSFFFTDRITAEHALRQQQRRLVVNAQPSTVEADSEEISQGLQDLMRGRSVSGLHHLSVLVHVAAHAPDDTVSQRQQSALATLEQHVGLLKKAFVQMGVKPVREWFALETFFWSQLPGQSQQLIGRRGHIQSGNFAGFASLHNYAGGKPDHNLWGPAIMAFETLSGTPYHFNFHREMEGMVAGHTTFTAETGAGKTTLLAALIAMADKVHPRVFWFDHRAGAKVFMAAMGAVQTTLSAQSCMQWNPFQLPDTPDNRRYLVVLLSLMCTCYGGAMCAEDITRFKQAVDENYALPFQDRRLRHIAWCFGQGALAETMAIWHGANGLEGANAGVFDNASDVMSLQSCRHYCFEMQDLIKDGVARPELAVMLSYPFHCIEQAMDGTPFIIVLEEGQNLVKHAYWREKIDSYLMQIRRKNGIVIFVTPDPCYLYCETAAILKQAVTQIYLPNSAARYEDYVLALGLTQEEFEFIRDTPQGARLFLIRRGQESIKARFDLSAMPALIAVLSSNETAVALMHTIIEEVGSNAPEDWVPIFMTRALQHNTHNVVSQNPC